MSISSHKDFLYNMYMYMHTYSTSGGLELDSGLFRPIDDDSLFINGATDWVWGRTNVQNGQKILVVKGIVVHIKDNTRCMKVLIENYGTICILLTAVSM